MALMAFWVPVVFMLYRMPLVSAYPVSIQSDNSVNVLSDVPKQEPALTPTIPPHGLELPLKVAAASVNGEVTYGNQPSKRDTSSGTQYSGGGPTPDETAGIALGATFAVLFVIAALMYAFRVGWKKGQEEKARATKKRPLHPPTSPGPWNQMNVIKSPDVVLEIWSGYWEGENRSGPNEHMRKCRTLSGYSFRPEKGVYEVQEEDIKKTDDIQEISSTGGSSRFGSGRTGNMTGYDQGGDQGGDLL